MNAFILAAGRGERLRPLTDHTPKPLITVDGRPVIDHTLKRLLNGPIEQIVINVWHLAEQLEEHLKHHEEWGGRVVVSREGELLETGGGICKALPLLGKSPFLAINGDILWDFDLSPLLTGFDLATMDALLLLVANPKGKQGDFILPGGTLGPIHRLGTRDENNPLTYSGIQVINPLALTPYPVTRFSLNRFYDDCIHNNRLYGMRVTGSWSDIGTPESLEEARGLWKFPLQTGADYGN